MRPETQNRLERFDRPVRLRSRLALLLKKSSYIALNEGERSRYFRDFLRGDVPKTGTVTSRDWAITVPESSSLGNKVEFPDLGRENVINGTTTRAILKFIRSLTFNLFFG